MNFDEIYSKILTNINVFITGAAGTGKTHNLKKIIKKLKEDGYKRIVTATTGIAANHINSMTIHRIMGFGIQNEVDYIEYIFKKDWWEKQEKQLKNAEFMIIDEISMMSPKQFKLVDLILKKVKNSNLPFGGMRMIFCGDFLQLPPINERTEGQIFETQEWKNANPFPIILKEVFRTSDKQLISVLSKIRKGYYDNEVNDFMNKISNKSIENPVKILSTNKEVNDINNHKLSLLPGKLRKLKSEHFIFSNENVSKIEKMIEEFYKNSLVEEEFYLKIGARVMFVRNQDSLNVFNGELGTVVGWKEIEDHPIVELDSGKKITVHKRDMNITDSKDNILATIWQQPLKLAYAITVHKTQGMTIPKIEIDANKFFAPGQLYVSLSRASSSEGLSIKNINKYKLKTNYKALKYYQKLEEINN